MGAFRLLTYGRKVILGVKQLVLNVIRQGFTNVCFCRVVFKKMKSLVRYDFDSRYIQIYSLCSGLYGTSPCSQLQKRYSTQCHVWWLWSHAPGRKSCFNTHTSRISIEAFSLEKAVEICLNALCADGTYFFVGFSIFSTCVKERREKTPKQTRSKIVQNSFYYQNTKVCLSHAWFHVLLLSVFWSLKCFTEVQCSFSFAILESKVSLSGIVF